MGDYFDRWDDELEQRSAGDGDELPEWHEDDVACLVDQEIHTVDKMPLVRVESTPAEIDCGQ